MAPPTKRVPAAFHSELTEYVSLLRSIRTSSTLDIVPLLSQAKPHVGGSHLTSDLEDSPASEEDAQLNDGEVVCESSEPTPDHDAQGSLNGKGKAKGSPKSTKRPRRKGGDDTWTRWPLLKEHCPLPEWSFDEEVIAIAEQWLRFQSSPPQTANNDHAGASSTTDFDDDMIEFILSPAHLSGLTSDAASKLTCVLALLASHRVNATFAKHGRTAPMSWVDVLEVVGVAGIFDVATVQHVKEYMESVFCPSESQIITRMQVLEASSRALAEAEASFGQDLMP